MKPRILLIHILAVLLAFPLTGAFAQEAPLTLQIVTAFNYPNGSPFTRPQKINNGGDTAGVIDAASGARRGFVRFFSGDFSPPIVDPNDAGRFTDLRGINDSNVLCGSYAGSDGLLHGFLIKISPVTFTGFDVPGASNTILLSNNNHGDLSGAEDSSGVNQAFVEIGGTVIPIVVPGASGSFAYGMNNLGEAVGQYTDGTTGIGHGFFRDASGTITAPIDPPGSTSTVLFGLNDHDVFVGRFTDSTGVERGFAMTPTGNVSVLDKPNATLTSLNGINNSNLICGRFEDSRGAHGILVQVSGGPAR